MAINIHCQDCGVRSLGKTGPEAIARFDEHVAFFHGAQGITGGAVGATETTTSGMDTSTWETRSEGAESEQEP